MNISVWLPEGVELPNLEELVRSLVTEKPYSFEVGQKTQDMVLVHLNVCEFDAMARLPIELVEDMARSVASQLNVALGRVYTVSCQVLMNMRTFTYTEPAYVGISG